MGLRYRKSISFLGGAFRINFSKSGIGYSYGGKGARVTHTARGTTRHTLSIPGTGISWVSESGKKRRTTTNANSNNNVSSNAIQSDQVLERNVENGSAEALVSVQESEFISAIKKYRIINKLLGWFTTIWLFVTIAAFSEKPYYNATVLLWCAIFVGTLIHKFMGKIKVTYSFDDYGKQKTELISQVASKVKSVNKIWQINTVYKNQNTKIHAGAGQSLMTTPVKIAIKKPSFLKTNVTIYEAKLKKEKIYIFPDKFLIVNGSKIGAIHYDDLKLHIANTNFILDYAPKDARVVAHTWKYVNKNGEPDKRYKDNRQLPICDVGTMQFSASQGLNVLIYLSSVYTTLDISNLLVPGGSYKDGL